MGIDSAAKGQTKAPAAKTFAHALARWLIKPLLHTPVTPNHLTTLRLVTGVAAAGAFASGDHFWCVWGGILFIISTLLDRADGELARLGDHISHFGHRYDILCDVFVNVVVFIGIGFGLSQNEEGNWAAWLGVFAGITIAAIFLVVVLLENDGVNTDALLNPIPGMDPDDTLFLIGPIAWLQGLLPLLLTTVVGAPVLLAWLLWRYRLIVRIAPRYTK